MKQVFLSGKGEIEVFDVPIPGRIPDAVLVRNAFSLISTGTEGSAVSQRGGWLGLAEKVMASRDRVQQVWDLAQTQGVSKTWDLIRNKLADYSALGYSSAGQVVEVSGNVPFRPGDRVACIGAGFATHSDYVVVPANLVAPISPTVNYDEAAFGALACIASQGIRRLELSPGEWVGVVGLGLIGQLAAQLLAAMGYRVVGMDLQATRAATARDLAGIEAWSPAEANSLLRVQTLTHGHGLDGVLICAATQSDQPVNMAFDLCRQRGRVAVVGDVGLNLSRAKMYKKELDLRMSTSYGPGRYDPSYEIQGQDYPYAYVRWTEKRNLGYFLTLLAQGRLKSRPLISQRTPVEQAPQAYTAVKTGNPATYGVLLDYGPLPETPEPPDPTAYTIRLPDKAAPSRSLSKDIIRLGLIGCGGFAKAVHIPNLKQLSRLFQMRGVASRTGGTARLVASREGFPLATSDYRVLLDDAEIDAVLITTRHAAHARIVLDALAAGKHVFVEKPMCITVAEGQAIVAKANETGLVVRVGFNRRFSPYLHAMQQVVGSQGPRIFSCRVNVSLSPADWSNTAVEGGRLVGEGVHFFDLCNWFIGQEPDHISAMVAGEITPTNPNVQVQLRYPDGSAAQVLYTSVGHSSMGKEFFEAFGNGRSAASRDYQAFHSFGAAVTVPKKEFGNKGQLAELEEFAAVVKGEIYPVIGADARAGLLATWTALAAYESAERASHIQLFSG